MAKIYTMAKIVQFEKILKSGNLLAMIYTVAMIESSRPRQAVGSREASPRVDSPLARMPCPAGCRDATLPAMPTRPACRRFLLPVIGTIVLAAGARAVHAQECAPRIRDLAATAAAGALARDAALRDARGTPALAAGFACDSARMVEARGFRWRAELPLVRTAFAGGVSDPRSEGGLWVGRGANVQVIPSIGIAVGPVRALLAPSLSWNGNGAYEVFPGADTSRSGFASPWYAGPRSIDLPSRFGTEPITRVDLGESALWVASHGVVAGAATGTQRWGPGLRGNLLLSPNAPGIPRGFVGTDGARRTRIGAVEALAFAGTLTESPWFDADESNDTRPIWAVGGTLSPAGWEALRLTLAHAQVRTEKVSMLALELRSARGVRGWAEVARQGGLPPMHQFLTIPYQGLAYLVGAEYRAPVGGNALMVALEMANLEQPRDLRRQQVQDFYTSDTVAQGWTQRGQLLGHYAGPGGQSQYLAVDWLPAGGRWALGIFGERTRVNEDAFLRIYLPYPNRHDVTMRGGARASATVGGRELALELSTGKRLNYLFQNATYLPDYRTVDLTVPQLRLSISPSRRP